MVNELKGCPFCGGSAAIHWRAGNAFASCEDLGCVGSDFSVDPASWNTRADTARLSELEAALREAELKIEYLHKKFQPTGTGEATLARIRAALEAQS